MKVLQVNAVYGFGSTGLIVRDIDLMLCNKGEKSAVVYKSANPIPKEGHKASNFFDSKTHAIWSRIYGAQAYGSIIETFKICRYIDKYKPDVVHIHNLHSNFLNLNIFLKYIAKKNIPLIVTLHDCWLFTGKCYHFIESKCNKWMVECERCPRNKLDIPSMIFDHSNKAFNDKKRLFQSITNVTVVGCSKWITSLASQSPIFRNKKITQIYNGVDTSVFKPIDAVIKNNFKIKHGIFDKNLVIIGMANKWLVPENTQVLNELNMISDISIILVGCNDEQKIRLKSLSNVIPIGYIHDRKELAELYAVSDVFINLTLADTLPTVNMESLSCGTPVITYDSAGSPELIKNNKTGFIIPQFDIKQLLLSLDKIRNGVINRADCRNYAVELFDKNRQYNLYIDLYKSSSQTK